jgi:hypothetical protein
MERQSLDINRNWFGVGKVITIVIILRIEESGSIFSGNTDLSPS